MLALLCVAALAPGRDLVRAHDGAAGELGESPAAQVRLDAGELGESPAAQVRLDAGEPAPGAAVELGAGAEGELGAGAEVEPAPGARAAVELGAGAELAMADTAPCPYAELGADGRRPEPYAGAAAAGRLLKSKLARCRRYAALSGAPKLGSWGGNHLDGQDDSTLVRMARLGVATAKSEVCQKCAYQAQQIGPTNDMGEAREMTLVTKARRPGLLALCEHCLEQQQTSCNSDLLNEVHELQDPIGLQLQQGVIATMHRAMETKTKQLGTGRFVFPGRLKNGDMVRAVLTKHELQPSQKVALTNGEVKTSVRTKSGATIEANTKIIEVHVRGSNVPIDVVDFAHEQVFKDVIALVDEKPLAGHRDLDGALTGRLRLAKGQRLRLKDPECAAMDDCLLGVRTCVKADHDLENARSLQRVVQATRELEALVAAPAADAWLPAAQQALEQQPQAGHCNLHAQFPAQVQGRDGRMYAGASHGSLKEQCLLCWQKAFPAFQLVPIHLRLSGVPAGYMVGQARRGLSPDQRGREIAAAKQSCTKCAQWLWGDRRCAAAKQLRYGVAPLKDRRGAPITSQDALQRAWLEEGGPACNQPLKCAEFLAGL